MYDLNRDFVPVTLAVAVPELLVAHPALPMSTANCISSGPEALAAFMRDETIKWGKISKISGIKRDAM